MENLLHDSILPHIVVALAFKELLELLSIASITGTDFREVDSPGCGEFWVVVTDPDTIVVLEGWIDGCTAGDDRNLNVAQLPNGQGIGNE